MFIGMDFINKLAVKYRSNPRLKFYLLFWHLYMPCNFKKRNRFFRLCGMELLVAKKVLDSEDCFFGWILEHYWVLVESMLTTHLDIDCAAFLLLI